MNWRHKIGAVALAVSTTVASVPASAETTITLSRFFGDCIADWGERADVENAVGECPIIQSLQNKFNAENDLGVKVVLQSADWGNYYDKLKSTYAARDVPDISVMHASRINEYLQRNLLTDLSDGFAEWGITVDEFVPAAQDNMQYEGGIYALPFDAHALLFHVNMDLMREAGLVDEDGEPILPSSPEEWYAYAEQLKEATGKTFFAMDYNRFSLGIRLWMLLVWQQGGEFFNEDGTEAMFDTEEGRNALELMKGLVDAGAVNGSNDYASAEQDFLNGEAAILINGTWVVDSYHDKAKSGELALKDHTVRTIPTIYEEPAVWNGSHMWVVPTDPNRTEAEFDATMAFLAFLKEHGIDWARTGHIPVVKSVIASEEFNALPLREGYSSTAEIGRTFPRINNFSAVEAIMKEEIYAVWQSGTSVEDALSSANRRINAEIDN